MYRNPLRPVTKSVSTLSCGLCSLTSPAGSSVLKLQRISNCNEVHLPLKTHFSVLHRFVSIGMTVTFFSFFFHIYHRCCTIHLACFFPLLPSLVISLNYTWKAMSSDWYKQDASPAAVTHRTLKSQARREHVGLIWVDHAMGSTEFYSREIEVDWPITDYKISVTVCQ